MKFARSLLSLVVLAVIFSGCTAMLPIKDANVVENILENVKPGDQVHIETKDGSKYEILVESISSEAVEGGGVNVPIDQIEVIKTEQILVVATPLAVVAGTYVVASVVFLITILTL